MRKWLRIKPLRDILSVTFGWDGVQGVAGSNPAVPM
jgi:hypothetical protein